jgi:hypothetical protein
MNAALFNDAVVVRYRRVPEKVGDEYVYEGSLSCNAVNARFEAWPFRSIVQCVHVALTQHPEIDRVVFQRTERPGICPYNFGPKAVYTFRTDPEAAYRSMDFNAEPSVMVTGAGDDSKFGRTLYLRVESGQVEDPLTGKWESFGYGVKHGWMIRPTGNNDTGTWLRVLGLIDSAPDGVTNVERLAFVHWALIDVEELLRRRNTHFYLPRPWNLNGPWITREELQHLYTKSKENAS